VPKATNVTCSKFCLVSLVTSVSDDEYVQFYQSTSNVFWYLFILHLSQHSSNIYLSGCLCVCLSRCVSSKNKHYHWMLYCQAKQLFFYVREGNAVIVEIVTGIPWLCQTVWQNSCNWFHPFLCRLELLYRFAVSNTPANPGNLSLIDPPRNFYVN